MADERVRVYLFVATLGYSRRCHVEAFRHERRSSWFRGLGEATFRHFGGITDDLLLDNARVRVTHHDAVASEVEFNDRFLAFAAHWGVRPRRLRAGPGSDGGEGRVRRQLRQAERDRGTLLRQLGGAAGASGVVVACRRQSRRRRTLGTVTQTARPLVPSGSAFATVTCVTPGQGDGFGPIGWAPNPSEEPRAAAR